MRHDPPGFANEGGARRKVFVASLEQAEQLFAAAATVDYASRPILLFYGLSQAGRAIATASTSADGSEWKLDGHGIKVSNLGQHSLPLHELEIRDDGNGSFTRLAPMLDSGTLPQLTQLGQVWNVIPSLDVLPGASGDLQPLDLVGKMVTGGYMFAWIRGVPIDACESEARIVDFLGSYPSITGSSSGEYKIGPIQRWEDHGIANIPRRWEWAGDRDIQPFTHNATQPYRSDGERFVFPILGGSDKPLSPLLSWWAVLFALSMLARYEPQMWTSSINVNRSATAVYLEIALERALAELPQLIHYALHVVSE